MSTFWDNYQSEAFKFAVYPDKSYPIYALASEVGELIGKFARELRGDSDLQVEGVLLEIGDCLWCASAYLKEQGKPLVMPYVSLKNYREAEEIELKDIAVSVMVSLCEGNATHALMGLQIIAKRMGSSIEECACMNLEKLAGRKARFTIRGEGDER